MSKQQAMSRRNFVAGAAAATGALTLSAVAAQTAGAAESGEADASGEVPANAVIDSPEIEATPGPSQYVDTSVPEWLGEAPAVADADITDTKQCDVLVVGCGTSGLFAACSAAENGAQVILIEKNPASPGVRGTLGAVGTKWQEELGVEIDKNEICHEMQMYAANMVSPALLKCWADNSAETVEWYSELCEKAGREFVICSDLDLAPGETVFKHWCTGHSAIMNGGTCEDADVLLDYADSLGVEVDYSCAMVELTQDDSERVTGVIATDPDDNYIKIEAAKGVILCTGGYGRNDKMMAALQPDTCKIFSSNSAMPGTNGDGIKAALWAGAAFDDTHECMLFDRCPLKPDEVAGQNLNSAMFWMASQPWLKVNLEGKRFCNESEPYDFTLHASLAEPDHTYVTLWDANYIDYIYQFKTQGCSRMFPFENGAPVSAITIDAMMGMNQGLVENGYIQQADTIEELAEKLNIPADNLKETVDHYNELVAAGEDTDFGKEPFRLSPLDTPPFCGVRQTGYLLCTMDGIHIDTDMNALRADGTKIEGLFMGGNDSGSFFAITYPDLIPGLAAGRSSTFGRRAGRIAATGE